MSSLNTTMIEVAEKAAEQGWYIIGYNKHRSRSGHVPGGVIAFVRDHAPFDDARCGTAAWGLSDLGVNFFSGHYDMDREAAILDLAKRMEA